LSDPPVLLFVVGMHRSGTSALCAALHACGATFGDRLLAPMAGVNDEGFWEDIDVVAANEALLAAAEMRWYAVSRSDEYRWPEEALKCFQACAQAILQRGFGSGPVQVIKDPRLCITLPLWLHACADLGLNAQVCIASRAPLEVAQSLQRRDGFPLGYGLRLDLEYRRALDAATPPCSHTVSFPELLQDAPAVMSRLATQLPLQVGEGAVAAAVRRDLRHHSASGAVASGAVASGAVASGAPNLLEQPVIAASELTALASAIEQQFPVAALLSEWAEGFVARGTQLTDLGESHSRALATIAERDEQIADLDHRLQETGAWLERALATVEERDGQVAELDRRLAEIGDMHSHALQVIAGKDREITDKDSEIAEIYATPVVGRILRRVHRKRVQ
jgi:hypothetical protein